MWKSQSQLIVFKRETLKKKLYIKSKNSLQSYVSREVPTNGTATGRKRKSCFFLMMGKFYHIYMPIGIMYSAAQVRNRVGRGFD